MRGAEQLVHVVAVVRQVRQLESQERQSPVGERYLPMGQVQVVPKRVAVDLQVEHWEALVPVQVAQEEWHSSQRLLTRVLPGWQERQKVEEVQVRQFEERHVKHS
jgi:hypothetical protein